GEVHRHVALVPAGRVRVGGGRGADRRLRRIDDDRQAVRQGAGVAGGVGRGGLVDVRALGHAADGDAPGAVRARAGLADEVVALVQLDRAPGLGSAVELQARALRDVVTAGQAGVVGRVQVRRGDGRRGDVDGPGEAVLVADVAGVVHRADGEGVFALGQAAEAGAGAGGPAAVVQLVLQVIDAGERVAAGEGETGGLAIGQRGRAAGDAGRRLRRVDLDDGAGEGLGVAGDVGDGHVLGGSAGRGL